MKTTRGRMLGLKVNTSRFDSTFKEYIVLSKRLLPDIINKMGYEISKLCVAKTPPADKNEIKASLHKASRVAPSMTIAEVISNKIRTSRGQAPLVGQKLLQAGLKYENKRARSTNFLRAGFLPPVAKFTRVVKDKSVTTMSGAKQFGMPKGGATVANSLNGVSAKASLWNSVLGGVKKWTGAPLRNIAKVQARLVKGIQTALNTKEADMRPYIEKKWGQLNQKFNKA